MVSRSYVGRFAFLVAASDIALVEVLAVQAGLGDALRADAIFEDHFVGVAEAEASQQSSQLEVVILAERDIAIKLLEHLTAAEPGRMGDAVVPSGSAADGVRKHGQAWCGIEGLARLVDDLHSASYEVEAIIFQERLLRGESMGKRDIVAVHPAEVLPFGFGDGGIQGTSEALIGSILYEDRIGGFGQVCSRPLPQVMVFGIVQDEDELQIVDMLLGEYGVDGCLHSRNVFTKGRHEYGYHRASSSDLCCYSDIIRRLCCIMK